MLRSRRPLPNLSMLGVTSDGDVEAFNAAVANSDAVVIAFDAEQCLTDALFDVVLPPSGSKCRRVMCAAFVNIYIYIYPRGVARACRNTKKKKPAFAPRKKRRPADDESADSSLALSILFRARRSRCSRATSPARAWATRRVGICVRARGVGAHDERFSDLAFVCARRPVRDRVQGRSQQRGVGGHQGVARDVQDVRG